MPRSARLDTPGVLHHIMIRGMERRKIFMDDNDREDFLSRLERLLPVTKTSCYAWAFMPNHAHFLFRTGSTPIATLMSRLLTGYAVYLAVGDVRKILSCSYKTTKSVRRE